MAANQKLPGEPPPSLSSAWEALTPEQRAAFLPHLLGGTGADWLSVTLKKHGKQLSATTIKTYRRALRQAGVQV